MNKNSLMVLLEKELAYILSNKTFEVDTGNKEEYILWIPMSEMMTMFARDFVQEENETYWYELCYHPDDDSVYVNVVGDANAEHLEIRKQTEQTIRKMMTR